MSDSIRRLHESVCAARKGRVASPRTAKLFARGRSFIAKKVAEEAVEVALDGAMGDAPGAVRESADLLYNLVVLWVELGIDPDDVWAEMRRREKMLGMAEKLPKMGKKAGVPGSGASPAAPLRHGDSLGHSGYAVPADLFADFTVEPAREVSAEAAAAGAARLASPTAPGPRRGSR
ncbi:phosphoribosyl-ATP diphosphatase [Ancylobacter sp. Lp-2]|uniref:phosphoribosyl-ATP diphosphatase n=1 Tax=Ancylobacter sp. Lp-2 TaxID=2881339 RepID=UPI0021026DA9|nr:phosphoribosyl-ATP diphosphatase [Ancylobacter sp. Lp-2]MCB4771710.1 phosphoribosyl-ATP diphosphatase [Ancylobacter sp. Lp-2]